MKADKSIAVLVERADMDWEAVQQLARASAELIADEPIGQLAQQMVEKLSRALLFTKKVRFGKEHDLEKFFEKLHSIGMPVPEEFLQLEDLTPFALRLRYDTMSRLKMDPFNRKALVVTLGNFREWALENIEGS